MAEVKTVLVTGSVGFLGRNLCSVLRRIEGLDVLSFTIDDPQDALDGLAARADFIFHLAGINRPQNVEEFAVGNKGLTEQLCEGLLAAGRSPKIVFSSSIQAELDNPYGQSKKAAEEALLQFAEKSGAEVAVYRLRNLFGKWCLPNYNSVTATFCHNVAHDLDLQISDPERELDLVYVDDVVAAFVGELEPHRERGNYREVERYTRVSLGRLAELIQSFRAIRSSLILPNLQERFVQELYTTYLSYLPEDEFAYDLELKTDPRGGLAEFLKSESFGQIFVSRTKPGITRGDHFHHTKTEKFLVLEGEGVIRFRLIDGTGEVLEYRVSGAAPRVVDIPPGYTHSIENVGEIDMITLFWASEIFNQARTDTYFEAVL